MNILVELEHGEKCKRSDWGYPEIAYISLEEHNHNKFFYMYGMYPTMDITTPTLYAMTYSDIISECWEVL